jgi:hypothetical protein
VLLVSHYARLADVCVKCATREGIRRRFEVMRHRRVWATVGLVALLCFYGLFASFTLTLLVPFTPWGWLTALVCVVVFARGWRYGAIELPICATCDARWRGVLRARFLMMLAIVPVGIAAAAVTDLGAHGTLLRGLSAWFAPSLIVVWATLLLLLYTGKWRNRTVSAKAIHNQLIFLRGVHPEARRTLVVEAVAAGGVRRVPPLDPGSAGDHTGA